MKKTRCLILLVVLSVLINSIVIPVAPAAGVIYESERNHYTGVADRTYDDYDNYGAITSYDDQDFWVISFEEEGMANFWLGNIPAGCNYDLIISEYDTVQKYARTNQTGNADEMIRLHVKANTNYYIRVYSHYCHYSDSRYKMRVKWYPLKDAKYFGSNISDINDLDSISIGDEVMGYLWDMNFPGYPAYPDNTANSVLNSMSNTEVMTIFNHASPGQIDMPTNPSTTPLLTTLYAGTNSSMTSNDRAISNIPNSSINMSLLVFCGCNSGVTDANGYNLVDEAIKKGAFSSIGWKNQIRIGDGKDWLVSFFEHCAEGYTVYDAALEADKESYIRRYEIVNRYYGSTRATENAKGTVIDLCE